MNQNGASQSFGRNQMHCHGHPPVCNVVDLVAHGKIVLKAIRERGDENDELLKLYELGSVGQHIPQGSIKSFRQYADYMTLSSLPIWPITPVKVSLFLLFRLLMGDVTNGTPLRHPYLRSLARSLEHYREETAKFFISRWPEAGQWIIRDGRGDPESRNDITHDILRICKLGQHQPLKSLVDFEAIQELVVGNNSTLTPDAWATRRRLSARWVRDRDSANLPERQYAGGKFIGEPPKPPPLSARSTHWNRHLHDLRDRSEETSCTSNASRLRTASIFPARMPSPPKDVATTTYENSKRSPDYKSSVEISMQPLSIIHHRPGPLLLHHASQYDYDSVTEACTSSLRTSQSDSTEELCTPQSSIGLPPITPSKSDYYLLDGQATPPSSKCVIPSLVEAGLHPTYFPLPSSSDDFAISEDYGVNHLHSGERVRYRSSESKAITPTPSVGGRRFSIGRWGYACRREGGATSPDL